MQNHHLSCLLLVDEIPNGNGAMYALANSACVPGMGSEEVVGEEQFLTQIQRR